MCDTHTLCVLCSHTHTVTHTVSHTLGVSHTPAMVQVQQCSMHACMRGACHMSGAAGRGARSAVSRGDGGGAANKRCGGLEGSGGQGNAHLWNSNCELAVVMVMVVMVQWLQQALMVVCAPQRSRSKGKGPVQHWTARGPGPGRNKARDRTCRTPSRHPGQALIEEVY